MKQLLFFIACTFICISNVKAQDAKSPKADAACCCADSVPCFEKDSAIAAQYLRQPASATKDIILDFRAKALGIPKDLKIKKGEFIRVKVVNYNPLLYKVSVDNKDSSVTQPNDGGFLSMFLSPDKLTGVVANLITTIGTPPKVVISDVNKTGDNNFLLEVMTEKKEEKTKGNPPVCEKCDSAKAIIEAGIADTKTKKKKILSLRKQIEEAFLEIGNKYAYLQKTTLNCDDLAYNTLAATARNYETKLKGLLTTIREINTDIYNNSLDFKFRLASCTECIISKPELKVKQSYVDTFYKIAASELAALDTSLSSKKVSEISSGFIKLAQNSPCYTSLPIYINGDVKTVSISLKPVDEKSNLPSYQTNFSLPTYQPKIWGITGGVFVSGLHNETYTNKRKVNDTTYNLVSDGQGKTQIGANALAYAGRQVGSKANYIAASFGAGMSLESKPKPRILIGASFITGDKNKILFSIGYTAGFVSRLSDAFTTTDNYVKPAENYQKDIIKGSVFFSLNYSFLNK